jgi:hypothetical protein
MDGCGAICPSYGRGCYGCFGPSNDVNLASYSAWLEKHGVPLSKTKLLVRGMNANSKEFREWLKTNE